MTDSRPVLKPKALRPGARIAPFAPASPGHADAVEVGKQELIRLGFKVGEQVAMTPEGFYAGPSRERRNEFVNALERSSVDALIATRGGYGSIYLLEEGLPEFLPSNKPIVGFSDLTTLQIYLWQKHRFAGFYGPMLAAGLNYGANEPRGYDLPTFVSALNSVREGWKIPLHGQSLAAGTAEGIVLGGAMTLLEATVGTAWEIQTDGAILILEDRGMKPYQIDRVLMHLKHAGKFKNIRGIILGDFPGCEAPVAGSPSVLEVCERILRPIGVPIVYGAPVGHTLRPMLTLPLGVKARLLAEGEGELEILEPAVVE